ncbi:PREDICTED: uncharacterized protein LOC108381355 [Rhagoletis zephyria]|uniref:uncharacterized protein LOC108381355 n=1 Tax=Rhagoletis zephyria TaxID=28612 RepID=UPI0008117AB8|nr:PREDICTED: uncharacterized protein LOC108381355 [Rhagoletis zephyria]
MPNLVNRFKPNPLMKMEKENENQDLRRKLKNLQKVTFRSLSERSPGQTNKETVWDRLSKVKKSASNEGSLLTGSKGRTHMPAKCSMRLQPARPLGQRTNKKPLTPNTNLNKRIMEKKSYRIIKGKAVYTPELEADDSTFSCKRIKSVKEIMTARSICDSKTSSDESDSAKTSPRSENMSPMLTVPRIKDYDTDDFEIVNQVESQDSLEDFVVAPLIPVPTTESLNMSAYITSNFCSLLDNRKKNMEPEEISVIKNVVKTDERHRHLQPNDSILFKDILKTQLKEIIRQEMVVKSALKNLHELPETDCPSTIATHKPSTPNSAHKKPQVDVIFKNVPTLEKEIIILKALGEKLEATLKRTVSQNELKLLELNKLATPIANKWHCSYPDNMEYASIALMPTGIRRCVGIVQEFRMELKTIVELKEQANQHFYLPSNKDNSELKRTTFKRLKENPDLLMRYLKPKNTLVPFNVLEQDPCFFNSFLYSPCVIGGMESVVSLSKDLVAAAPAAKLSTTHAGNSARSVCVPYKYVKEPLKIEEIQNTLTDAIFNEQPPIAPQQQAQSLPTEPENEELHVPRVCEAPVRGRKRRRIRKRTTPLSPYNDTDPKNNLFKTILVGSVQISVFLLLIMAVTYPDVRC